MAAWTDAMIAMMIATMMIAKTETIGGRFHVEANRGIQTQTGAIQIAIGTNASQVACPSTTGTTMGWTPVEKTLGATAATTRSATATIERQVVVTTRVTVRETNIETDIGMASGQGTTRAIATMRPGNEVVFDFRGPFSRRT
jgi:hypothetical protein